MKEEEEEPLLKGTLHQVDCEALNNLIQEYERALEDNYNRKQEFERFRDDYVKLKNRLKTLPEKVEYEAFVPICSKAMCQGRIIHTNEILVLLGENTFVECSAKKAAEIVTHRLKSVDEKLNKLDKEKELFDNWKVEAERQMVETLGDGTVEIVEEYNEQTEQEWKKGHREKVRKYHQELAKERQETKAKEVKCDGEKLWNRLDALELEEEFMEAQAVYEQRLNDSSLEKKEDKCTVKIREKADLSLKEEIDRIEDTTDDITTENTSTSGKKVTFSPENIIHNLTDLKAAKKKGKESDINDKEHVELYKPSIEVSDNGLNDPIFIRFRHDPSSFMDDDDLVSSESDSEDEIDYQILTNPGDIYEQFGPPALEAKTKSFIPGADKVPLKSILKPRPSTTEDEPPTSNKTQKGSQNTVAAKKPLCGTPSVSVLSNQVTERLPDTRVNEVFTMFPGLKVEDNRTDQGGLCRDTESSTVESTSRPVSLFKRMRAAERASPTTDD